MLDAQNSIEIEYETAIDVLLVGPWDIGEFVDLLPTISARPDWQRSTNCREAATLLRETDFAPELILLANPLPGTHPESQIEQLRLAAPLARLVVVAGTWCEGEMRTGTPLSGVLRLYWYELPGWWSSSTNMLQQGGCPPWSQPMDGPSAGRCLDSNKSVLSGIVAIDCKSATTFEALADALGHYGAECHWTRRGQLDQLSPRVIAGIWDGSQLDPLEVERLRSFSQEIGKRGGSVVALLDFPRREHLAIVRDAGCQAVLGKPYIVDELVSRIAAWR